MQGTPRTRAMAEQQVLLMQEQIRGQEQAQATAAPAAGSGRSQFMCERHGCPRRAVAQCRGFCSSVFCAQHLGACDRCGRSPFCSECAPPTNHTCVPERTPPGDEVVNVRERQAAVQEQILAQMQAQAADSDVFAGPDRRPCPGHCQASLMQPQPRQLPNSMLP